MGPAWRLLSAVFHADCALCGARVEDPRLGPACAACWRSLPRLVEGCPRCALPLPRLFGPAGERRAPCPDCRALSPAYSAAAAAAPYRGPWRRFLADYKFRRRTSVRRALAAEMAAACRRRGLRADALVAAPSLPRRSRLRGFDPAGDLALSLAGLLGLPCAPGALRRRPVGLRQAALDRRRRLANLDGAIEARLPPHLAGARLLLVDDILTTGATADACARALLSAGAARVDVVVAARSLRRGEHA